MKKLSEYCLQICCINGLDTYIISPQYHKELMDDTKLLEEMHIRKDRVPVFVDIAAQCGTDRLYIAFVIHKNYAERFQWEIVNCLRNDDGFFHVFYRDSWKCRECGNIMYAPVLMPMDEADATFYSGMLNRCPPVPDFFKKVPCPSCGRLMQNHLLLL